MTRTPNNTTPSDPWWPPEQREIWTLVQPGTSVPHGPPNYGRPSPGPFGRDEILDRMTREYGAARVVHVIVENLDPEERTALVARLKELSGATASLVSGGGPVVSVHLAPVTDLKSLADRIAFGKVTSVDPKTRTIEVRANR